MLDWNYIQENSLTILDSGLEKLKGAARQSFDELDSKGYGNYLISCETIHYIGESKELPKRLKQHSRLNTSTFYKNYLTKKADSEIDSNLLIENFEIRLINTLLGRKEMEEFGIVYLPAILNKFQQDKVEKITISTQTDLWDNVQCQKDVLLVDGEEAIFGTKSSNWFDASPPATGGVYWVEHPDHDVIYIGESSGLLSRWKTHSKQTYFSALRRHIGENILGVPFEQRDGKKKNRYFSEKHDLKVTQFLEETSIRILPTQFARYELEEYLISKYKPLLNRKGKIS